MAINKTINKRTNTHGAMRNCIEYVLRQDKTSELLTYVTGPYCHDEINYDLVYRTFLEEKKMWDKDSGRMYAHNIISWHKDEQITPEQALEFGKEFAENWFSGFQTLMAVHKDKDHIHCHLVTNSVSYEDGRKLHNTKKDLERMKQLTNLQSLVRELAKLPDETEWVEFKCNNKQPQMIGEYISALSNSAALCERPKAYLVWGVDDATHKIVGTEFQYRKMKKGNEELEAWLSRMLSPRINFRFFEVPMDEGMVVLMEIPCAEKQPVQFAGGEYIRIGTNKKNLKEYPDKERELWRTFDSTPYELRIAMGNLNEDEMVSLLDYSKYYDKLEMPIPRNRDKVLEDLQHEKFIMKNDAGTWDITNMGALMIAKDLKKFESLHRRSVRVIWYKENSRLDAIREKEFCAGYAFSHEEIVQYIMTIIPQEEVIVEATRKSVVSFPEIAIRELLANAMIHQDLQQRGTNPMVEVFKNRIEFSNAGAPLVAIERIVDSVPVSRNENIAGFMHKCGICEERGSGYDKIVEATGKNELLAPRIENQNNQFTKAILFAKVPFELTTKEDRMRTCYMQACLAYVNFEGISNSDIRKIFGLGEKEKAKASRLLTSAVEGGYIKVMDPDTAPRYKKYIPYWA